MRKLRLFSIAKHPIISIGLMVYCLALLADQSAAQTSVAFRDGLLADLQVSGDRALVRWRFLKPLTSPLKEISGDLDGEPLGIPRIASYPVYGDITRVLVLIDPTGAGRTPSLNKQIAAAVEFARLSPQHVQIAFGVYSTETRVLAPRDLDQLVSTLALINAPEEHPDLVSALTSGIGMLSALPAQRRALFVFTDGHSEVPFKNGSNPGCKECAQTIADLAFQSGVSVSFILADSSRSKELDPLRMLAERTGGQLVDEAGTIPFIAKPLDIVDSGGSAVFPIPQHPVYFWQSHPEVKINFVHGDKQLVLSAPAQIPAAGPVETARYIGSNHPYIAGGAGAAVLALVAGGIFLARRPRRAAEGSGAAEDDEPELRPVFAILQNIDDGTSHSISSDRVNLGRASTNDIVINDKAVSREHAVIFRDENGQFVIENSGVNGTSVNHLQIERAPLSSGDLITIGDSTLRFVQAKA